MCLTILNNIIENKHLRNSLVEFDVISLGQTQNM